jgi:ADP-heptose:LPS heptosyltransferase
MAATRGNKTLKNLDRYLGIPLLVTASLMPKRTLAPHTARRIGLMKTAAVGDTLLLAGLIEDVGRTYPNANVILITGADNFDAAKLLSGRIAEHVVVSPRHPFGAIAAIRRARLDVIVDFGSWPRFDALLAASSGAKLRIGFKTPGQFRHFGFDRVVAHTVVHERDNYVRLLAELGVHPETPARIEPPHVLGFDRFPSSPYVIFHPWSGGYMHQVKEWPTDRWVALATWARSLDWTVVLTATKGESAATAALATTLRPSGAKVFDAAGRYTLAELADVIAGSRAVITVNTGVAHLAGLIGARTVSLEGPTPPSRWRPLGPRVRTVTSTLPGCGYLDLGFEYAGQRLDCMEGVSVLAVIQAAEELLVE